MSTAMELADLPADAIEHVAAQLAALSGDD